MFAPLDSLPGPEVQQFLSSSKAKGISAGQQWSLALTMSCLSGLSLKLRNRICVILSETEL